MKIKSKLRNHSGAIITFAFGCMAIVMVFALDRLLWRTEIFAEGWPNFSFYHVTRSVVLFIAMLAIFWSLISSKTKLVLYKKGGLSIEPIAIIGTLFLSLIFLILFLVAPSTFSFLSREDGPVEWGSALLLFASSMVFLISSLKCFNSASVPNIIKWSLTFLTLLFFVMAMEEVSWFQRVLEIKTPESFEGNLQKEMNFHNFATNYAENLYYFGAFIFLVVFPFMRLIFPFLSRSVYLRTFMARPFIGIVGAVACAYNFDMWNIVFTQVAFFGSIVILMAFAIFSKKDERKIILLAIILMIATQVLFLANGYKFSRIWEVTEYKEFFIPLAFFIYSWDVLAKIDKLYFEEN